MTVRATVLISGMLAADPYQGGAAWAVLQYVLGLRKLGCDVYVVEPVPKSLLRPSGTELAASENAAYFQAVMEAFDLHGCGALLEAGTQQTVGLPYQQLRSLAGRADMLINISGMLTDDELTAPIPVRVYLDLDPAFNQLWHAAEGINMRFSGHSHFVTVGLAIGEPGCSVPTCGQRWFKTLQPVVLDRWPVADTIRYDGLTTVGNWRGYGSIEYNGIQYGQKAHSFRALLALPGMTHERFMPALAIHPGEVADLEALSANGWTILDPAGVANTPEAYQQFIQGSKAELGIAKSGYVAARCGWFSDRSACYLASGRPVIAQDTGFSAYLPTGKGLFAFTEPDDVLAAVDALNADYPLHARCSRAIAEDYCDSDKVLRRLLEHVGIR